MLVAYVYSPWNDDTPLNLILAYLSASDATAMEHGQSSFPKNKTRLV